jgi:hypothetical protein
MTDAFIFFFYFLAACVFVGGAFFYFFVMRKRAAAELSGVLDTLLFRVLIPRDEIPAAGEAKEKDPKEIILGMEQFYAAFRAIDMGFWHNFRYGAPRVVFEAALPHVGEEVIFYVAIPRTYAHFMTNQINAIYPSAKIDHVEDYNIFHPTGISMGSILSLKKHPILSIRGYAEFGRDPLEIITGAFAKLKKIGDGAAVQVVVTPTHFPYNKEGKDVAQKIRAGIPLKEALVSMKGEIKKIIKGPKKSPSPDAKPIPGDEELAKQIEEKASHSAFDVNIRLIASSETPDETEKILQGLEGAFAQFANPQGNEFKFTRVGGAALENMLYQFSFRAYSPRDAIYLSARELAALFHFPYAGFTQPNVQYLKAREAPTPVDLPSVGLRLGANIFRGVSRDVYITEDDRRRHMYVIGQTGTGKSTLLKEMAVDDIRAGRGVCFIDPHGQDVEALIAAVPDSRIDDVIYFNPGDVERPLGLNFLEYDARFPEQKSLIVNELLDIFNKLYNMQVAGGPMFEQYFRNATMLVMEDPASGNTLLEVERIMVDKQFRDYKLSRSANIVVNTFWQKIAEKAGGEASLQNMVPYITSKFDTFLANDIMRPIIAQEHSAFQFRQAMDEGKILLINLSKGRLGELNSALLGLIIVGRILIASLSRADITDESKRRDFYFYIDEFQNVTTKSIATILSEARKYRLNLVIAHQFLGQLEEDIRKAVFGNVGTMIAFRIGSDDGEFMEKQFSPVFAARDLLNIDNRNAYVKLLIHGQTARAFNMKVYPPANVDIGRIDKIKEISRLRYGRPRTEVEEEIRSRYHNV